MLLAEVMGLKKQLKFTLIGLHKDFSVFTYFVIFLWFFLKNEAMGYSDFSWPLVLDQKIPDWFLFVVYFLINIFPVCLYSIFAMQAMTSHVPPQ